MKTLMRHRLLLLLLLFIPATCWGQLQEILRPTVDVDGGTTSIGCAGANVLSLSMPNAYDNGGLSTSSNDGQGGSTTQSHYNTRVFKTWGTSSQSGYTALTLNVNTASAGQAQSNGTGFAGISYSINGGSTWTNIRSGSAAYSQITDTITLSASQDLTKLQVAVCAEGDQGTPSTIGVDNIQVWDIWTSGTYNAPPTPTPGPTPPPPAVAHPIITSRAKHAPGPSFWATALIWLSGILGGGKSE